MYNSIKYDRTLISRDLLFGNPDRETIRISPDGSKISFLAPVNGVLNIWVGPVEKPEEAKPVTSETHRGIRSYIWAYTGKHILYLQDRNGDENWRIYSVNLSSGGIKDLTPLEGVNAKIVSVSEKIPEELIVGLNKRDPQYHDIYRLNIETGNLTQLIENREFVGFDIDDYFKIHLASKTTPDGGIEIFQLTENGWEIFLKVGMEDALSMRIMGFSKTNEEVYLTDSSGRNTAALFIVNLRTGNKTLIAEDTKADCSSFMIHPKEKNVQAVAFEY
jgi:Tol biopolymer transport system component